jgi:hypothetical protein
MKQLRYVDQIWLVSDATAGVLLDFAAALARAGSAQHLTLEVLDINGTPEQVEFLIGPATMMTAEPSSEEFADPDNASVEELMRMQISELDAATR